MAVDNYMLELATIRRNRGITLEQIAESTKISMRSLRAIENGEFAKLPGGIYNTNYLRQYARAIDFDEAELLACYQAFLGLNTGPQSETGYRGRRGLLNSIRAVSIAR